MRWNQNAKHCHIAQFVLAALLSQSPPDSLAAMEGVASCLRGLIPYTERHFQRLDRLEQVRSGQTVILFIDHHMLAV